MSTSLKFETALAIAIAAVLGRPVPAAVVPVTSGLQLHLDASVGLEEADASAPEDGDRIAKWVDQSVNAAEFTPGNATFFGPIYVASSPMFNDNPVLQMPGGHVLAVLDTASNAANVSGDGLSIIGC